MSEAMPQTVISRLEFVILILISGWCKNGEDLKHINSVVVTEQTNEDRYVKFYVSVNFVNGWSPFFHKETRLAHCEIQEFEFIFSKKMGKFTGDVEMFFLNDSEDDIVNKFHLEYIKHW